MNRRGELEIALNKRTIERAVFLLIIVVLGILLVLKGSSSADPALESRTVELETQLNESTTTVAALQAQLTEAKDQITQLEKTKETPQQTQTSQPTVEAPKYSGVVTYNWEADGEIQTPAQYNKDQIATLQAELDDLEEQKTDATGAERTQLNEDINDLENQIAALEEGDTKLRLRSVTITIDNDKDADASYDYLLCWVSFDCSKVKTAGSLNVHAGETVEKQVDLTIPTFLNLDKVQVLSLAISQDESVVFKDEKSYRK